MNLLLTGGGTAGHVIPNIAIRDTIHTNNPTVGFVYIGSKHGVEKKLCAEAGIPFESIQTGKWRRYFDLRNLVDIVRVGIGVVQSFFKLRRLRPHVVFSKGGFVGFPVVFAAWILGIPVMIHESDVTVGLATWLTAPFAKKIFLGYEETVSRMEKYAEKLEVVGTPIREELFTGDKKAAQRLTGFKGDRFVLLVMGGSTGSQELNERLRKEKKKLMETYDILHITGEGKGKAVNEKHYYAIPYADKEMKDLYALADKAISRAGATALAELEALGIPAVLFPLGLNASRGDQMENAKALVQKNAAYRIAEEGKSIEEQVKLLPERKEKKGKNTSAQKIALNLLA